MTPGAAAKKTALPIAALRLPTSAVAERPAVGVDPPASALGHEREVRAAALAGAHAELGVVLDLDVADRQAECATGVLVRRIRLAVGAGEPALGLGEQAAEGGQSSSASAWSKSSTVCLTARSSPTPVV